jgi:decaprenylphospho-beta-D-erythro-pentofuranosid-2-ulose 2-reductase
MNLLVLGANSDLAFALAKKFAQAERADICLSSRNLDALEKKVTDIQIRYRVKASAVYFDALDLDSHRTFFADLPFRPDGVVVAFGLLGDQSLAQQDARHAKQILDTNYTGAASILEIAADEFGRRGHGFIIGVSSVAGERGRQSNYFYGAAKGAFSIYLSGLRNRINKQGVHVITALPGFMRTKMTESLDLPEALTATVEQAADDIYRGYKKSKDIVYTRWFWKWIMAVIKSIPEPLFKRMGL